MEAFCFGDGKSRVAILSAPRGHYFSPTWTITLFQLAIRDKRRWVPVMNLSFGGSSGSDGLRDYSPAVQRTDDAGREHTAIARDAKRGSSARARSKMIRIEDALLRAGPAFLSSRFGVLSIA